ncbi:MAG: hypothetical protein ABSE66_07870 [Thermoplasmata archaeon]|jgi:hypothetical protein
MPASNDVPEFKAFSPSMRVDLLISDWKAAIGPEFAQEERERRLYGQAWEAYREGDYGFGLWCWHECDRLTNNLNGNIREVTRILGPGRYFGFSHRRVVAEAVPVERIYRPRKGDMSTPRTDAFVLPHYQVLCVYLIRASTGDPKAKATLEIALGELEDQRRADPFLRHFETFRDLLARTSASPAPPGPAPAAPSPAPTPRAKSPGRRAPAERRG